MLNPCTIALDVGATKIAYGLVPDDHPTEVRARDQLATYPAAGDARQAGDRGAAQQVVRALHRAASAAPAAGLIVRRVGIGAPGVIDPRTATVTHAGPTMPGWQGTDLRHLVAEATGLQAAVTNDVRASGLAEAAVATGTQGPAGRGERALFLSFGTGLGGAVIAADGELLSSPRGTAGEVSELRCADCFGRSQRAELVASGTGLTLYYNDVPRGAVDAKGWPPPVEVTWRQLRASDTRLEDIPVDDAHFRAILNGNLFGFGQALGAVATAFDIPRVVIGGGLSKLGARLVDPLRAGLESAALPPARGASIQIAVLGLDAPLVGAATLARNQVQ